jgi:hypothetical protein
MLRPNPTHTGRGGRTLGGGGGGAAGERRRAGRVRPHHRLRNMGTDSRSESGIKWMCGRTTRRCDRTLVQAAAGWAALQAALLLAPGGAELQEAADRLSAPRGPPSPSNAV